ncbi:MAG: hypothetical protein ABJK39_10600 [Hyphomicrobiales bacterium]
MGHSNLRAGFGSCLTVAIAAKAMDQIGVTIGSIDCLPSKKNAAW